MPDVAVWSSMRQVQADRPLLELFAELAAGSSAALEPLYRALADEVHGLALWRTGSEADAADVLQEVFVRLARAGVGLRRVRSPRAYVRRMAHRAAVDVHRSRRGQQSLTDACLVERAVPPREHGPDAARAIRALQELSPQQREAIYLHVFSGCSFSEVARATGVPTFTAASRYRLGLARLRRLLGVKS